MQKKDVKKIAKDVIDLEIIALKKLKNSDDQLTQEIQQQVLDFFNNCKLSDNSDNELDDKDPQQVGQLLELDELPNSSLLPLNFNLDGIEEDSDDSLSFESLTFHNNPFGAVIIPNQKYQLLQWMRWQKTE